jgi:cell wall-associated NlpC family hydrolase
VAGAAVVPQVALAAPDKPKAAPTVASVQRELGRLALKNSQLVEKYNQARLLAAKRKVEAVDAARAAVKAKADFDSASADMSRTLTAQYEGSSISSAAALLTSSSGQTYLERLDTLNMLSTHTAQVVDQMDEAKSQADATSAAAKKMLTEANAEVALVSKTKTQVQKQIDKYKATLGMLTAAQQAAFTRSINPAVSASTIQRIGSNLTASRKARIAVQFALAQVGKPYVWGAAGPGSYDCSGLTMASWHAAGVNLPHSAAQQYNYGTHVSLSQIVPGDLIFMYSPIGHVTIYIGDGMMVSAPQSGENVSVVPVSSFSSDIVGATHLG